MTQVRISFISGATLPIQVYVADVYGNNETLVGTITSSVPPEVQFNSTIPAIFDSAPAIMLKLVDANGCTLFKILDCTFGCSFNITVELVDCIVDIQISPSVCSFSL